VCDNGGCGDVECADGTGDCQISCDTDSCTNNISCVAENACDIVCDGNRSCQQQVECDSENGDCAVVCSGDESCGDVDCVAEAGTCDIDCNGDDACPGGLTCNAQREDGDCE
jgi:hypothetical protein